MQTKIRFLCYHCRRVHTVDSSAAGRRGRCLCGTLMVVPDLPPEAEPWRPDSMPVALPAEEIDAFGGNGHRARTAPETGPWKGGPWKGGPEGGGPEGGGGSAGSTGRGIPIGAPEILAGGMIGSGPSERLPDAGAEPGTRERPAKEPSRRRAIRRRARAVAAGAAELLLSLPVLAWAFLQTFHAEVEGWREFREGWSLPAPDYLSLPPALWSTLLFALFFTLFLDGWRRLWGRRGPSAGSSRR